MGKGKTMCSKMIVHYTLKGQQKAAVLVSLNHGETYDIADDEYVLGIDPAHYPVPAVECGAHIQEHIVDIITPMQSTLPDHVDWVYCNEHGYVWSVAHWWNDGVNYQRSMNEAFKEWPDMLAPREVK
jgi:hypothetical protein